MELQDTCTILLDKSTQKIKCFKFKNKELGRELALHEDTSHKDSSTITDVKTGMKLFIIHMTTKQVKENDIEEGLKKFIKHFTMKAIEERLQEEDLIPIEEKIKGKKKQ